jgi:hypothetical protein
MHHKKARQMTKDLCHPVQPDADIYRRNRAIVRRCILAQLTKTAAPPSPPLLMP